MESTYKLDGQEGVLAIPRTKPGGIFGGSNIREVNLTANFNTDPAILTPFSAQFITQYYSLCIRTYLLNQTCKMLALLPKGIRQSGNQDKQNDFGSDIIASYYVNTCMLLYSG